VEAEIVPERTEEFLGVIEQDAAGSRKVHGRRITCDDDCRINSDDFSCLHDRNQGVCALTCCAAWRIRTSFSSTCVHTVRIVASFRGLCLGNCQVQLGSLTVLVNSSNNLISAATLLTGGVQGRRRSCVPQEATPLRVVDQLQGKRLWLARPP